MILNAYSIDILNLIYVKSQKLHIKLPKFLHCRQRMKNEYKF